MTPRQVREKFLCGAIRACKSFRELKEVRRFLDNAALQFGADIREEILPLIEEQAMKITTGGRL